MELLSSGLPQIEPHSRYLGLCVLDPAKCGVMDSIIASKYPHFGFSIDGKGYAKGTAANMEHYDSYCAFLSERAQDLNSSR